MNIRKLYCSKFYVIFGLVSFGATGLLILDTSFACACKRKTTGYFQKMGVVEPVAVRRGGQPGLAKSLTGGVGDSLAGAKVVVDRKRGNCLACHRISALKDEPFHGDIGPSLNRVALRYSEPQLRQMLVDARVYFPKTIMPPFHKSSDMYRVRKKFKGQKILSAGDVENVLAFLKTLK